MLAKQDVYIGAAVQQLEIISQDEQLRNAYTARLKAIMDYNTQMAEQYEAGVTLGESKKENKMIAAMRKLGMPEEQIQKIIETQAAMNG